jgi:transposase-like protein
LAKLTKGNFMRSTEVCPDCHSDRVVKNGHIRSGKQNFLRQTCGRNFIENHSWETIYSDTIKQINRALNERNSLRGICRIFGISLSWLDRSYNAGLDQAYWKEALPENFVEPPQKIHLQNAVLSDDKLLAANVMRNSNEPYTTLKPVPEVHLFAFNFNFKLPEKISVQEGNADKGAITFSYRPLGTKVNTVCTMVSVSSERQHAACGCYKNIGEFIAE